MENNNEGSVSNHLERGGRDIFEGTNLFLTAELRNKCIFIGEATPRMTYAYMR
jgi:hypothetical protein